MATMGFSRIPLDGFYVAATSFLAVHDHAPTHDLSSPLDRAAALRDGIRRAHRNARDADLRISSRPCQCLNRLFGRGAPASRKIE